VSDKSALNFADTAVKAIRMETLHLYDNAIKIIAEVIGFSKSEIASGLDLDALIKAKKPLQEINIDEKYSTDIKGIYSAIIAFISNAKVDSKMAQSSDIHWLRKANISIVESIKATKHLQTNMLKYS